MERFEKEPLARVSDGNLTEKYVDWKENFLARMKEHKLDRLPGGKKMIEDLTSHDKKLLTSDALIGLNARRKEILVKLMHISELKLSLVLEKKAAKHEGNVDEASSVASTSSKVSSSDASYDDSKESQDSKTPEEDENSQSTSNGIMCRRCGLFCANYKKCPAFLKQCRKCGHMHHFEKMCNKIPIASVSDGDLVDKWINWNTSFMRRMRQYNFHKSPLGKQKMDDIKTFGRDILSTDRRIGLNAQRKQEVVSKIYNMEYVICKSIIETKKVEKSEDYCGSSESSKGSTDVVEAIEKLDCLTVTTSPPECKVLCLQCGLCCGNYNRCPAIGKQCRRCFRNDHYEKLCNWKISTANNQFIYSPEIIGQIEVPKKTNLARVYDKNFMEKWFDWKQSFRVRMREYNFDSTSRGKEAIDKVSDFGKEIVKQDREFGLKRDRKREVLNLMCKFERNLLDNIARIMDNEEIVVDSVDILDKPKDEDDTFAMLCYQCGYGCEKYKQCPARGKKCRRCHRYNHYASMCQWKRSRYELRCIREEKAKYLLCDDIEIDEESIEELMAAFKIVADEIHHDPSLHELSHNSDDFVLSDDDDDIYLSDDDYRLYNY